jgi:hypothetical protein
VRFARRAKRSQHFVTEDNERNKDRFRFDLIAENLRCLRFLLLEKFSTFRAGGFDVTAAFGFPSASSFALVRDIRVIRGSYSLLGTSSFISGIDR